MVNIERIMNPCTPSLILSKTRFFRTQRKHKHAVYLILNLDCAQSNNRNKQAFWNYLMSRLKATLINTLSKSWTLAKQLKIIASQNMMLSNTKFRVTELSCIMSCCINLINLLYSAWFNKTPIIVQQIKPTEP